MYSISAAFAAALRVPHIVVISVDVYRGGSLIQAGLPVAGGEVTVDASSQVRRGLSLKVADPTLAPDPNDPSALLSPYGTELYVRRGIQFPDGTQEIIPVGMFRLTETKANIQAGTIDVTGTDRSKTVADDKFTAPMQSITTNKITTEIARLINGTLPSVTVTDTTGVTTLAPLVTWDQDRWGAVAQLAESIGAETVFDPTGAAVIRNVPAITNPVVWTIDAGETGVLIGGETRLSREGTYNSVTMAGERTDGTAPVVSTVTDTDPTSPTYYSGPFGHVPKFATSPLVTTTAQATAAATALLNRSRALVRQVDVTAVPNPALDAGDVITVVFPSGTRERHIIESLKVPLDATTAMTITTRSSDPNG